jgi:hypothetical protein
MTFFSFLVSFPVSTQTVALREPQMNGSKRQIGICSCPCGQEEITRIARSLSVDAYRPSGCGEEFVQPKQSAKPLDVQKNVLLNGFDVSTENAAFFNAIFQKK